MRRVVPLALLQLAVGVGLGFAVTYTDLTTPHERRLSGWLATHHGDGWLADLMRALTDLASPVAGTTILVAAIVSLLALRHPVRAARTAAVIVFGWASSTAVKHLVHRDRPPGAEATGPGYPSGHVACATAIALAAYLLARGGRYQRRVGVLGGGYVVLIAFSRVYLGEHYPTDVLGAVVVTTAVVALVCRLCPVDQPRIPELRTGVGVFPGRRPHPRRSRR